jgi:hypothetical protein
MRAKRNSSRRSAVASKRSTSTATSTSALNMATDPISSRNVAFA